MTGVKQQFCVALDTDVPDPEKQRAGGLAYAFYAELLTACVVLPHDLHKIGHVAAFAVRRR